MKKERANMKSEFEISIVKVAENFQLEEIYMPEGGRAEKVSCTDVNRPGLQMVGFFDYFDSDRIQVLGKVEYTFLQNLTSEKRGEVLDKLFSYKFPMMVLTRGMQVLPEILTAAEKYSVSVYRTEVGTSSYMSALISYLNVQLAPRRTRHGVLVEVYGEGVLIMGESGVGKSETAIELVKRGHRLVADDAVEIKRVSDKTLVGTSPDVIRHFVELRGIGIIDIKEIFGMGAVKDTESINLIIHLEKWDENKQYDRLGLVDEFTNIMGINVPSLTIPVKLGRNLAVIVEVAAMNNRQKRMGYNAAVELNKRLTLEMEKSMKENMQ